MKGEHQPVVRAYVLADGQVISGTYMDQYASKGHETESKQLPPDRWDKQYSKQGLVRPLYNLEALARLLEVNTYHRRATTAKASDVIGRGWRLVAHKDVETPDEDQWRRANEFFKTASPGLPLGELFRRVLTDYDATGNGYIEIVDSPVTGLPLALYHAPAHTIRRHQDFHRYAQMRGQKVRWFAEVGFDRAVNMQTGQIGERGAIPADQRASKLMHLMNYSSRSDYYGLPDVLPALGAMLGDLYRRDYNVKFFENHAIPAYVVTVTGAELDPDTERKIQDFFQHKVKGNPHSTLVLTAAGGDPSRTVQFKFEKLAVEIRDASFRLYRIDNRDEVLTAHGVPPYRAGIAEAGSLGQNVARETTEIYKDSVIGPRQTMLAWMINLHILTPLGVTDWQFEFVEIDTTDEAHEADIRQRYFRMGALTPNQIRVERGLDPEEDPAMDAYYVAGRAITGPAALVGSGEPAALLNSIKALHSDLLDIIRKGAAQ